MDRVVGRKFIDLMCFSTAAIAAVGCAQDAPDLSSTHQAAVSGAAFTTDDIWVDGDSKDICKNTSINCNIYGAKKYVWLNGGPSANGLGPDGQYFFAVMSPGGQPNPNDGGAKNLSDDFDAYTNRTFAVSNGEVSAYAGTHDLDSGNLIHPNRKTCTKPGGCAPDGMPPFLRLAPYADTTNPGGVYIMAICSLADGYPVDPRDCKYDAFKVKQGPVSYDLMLSGMKFQDTYADGIKNDSATDPGLAGWTVTITGTGFAGEPINTSSVTDANGYWDFAKSYSFRASDPVYTAQLTICEVMQSGWYQSYPSTGCYQLSLAPSALAAMEEIDFGNWQPVDVTACKEQDLDAKLDTTGDRVRVAGWSVSLTRDGVVVDTQSTGADGCYTWNNLTPGHDYGVQEGDRSGWEALSGTSTSFGVAPSGHSFAHTFVNAVFQGCTPGFWQGGSDGGQAGGMWLWNEPNDPQWATSGGNGTNPYTWTTLFNDFFTPSAALAGFTMMDLVGTGGGALDAQKAGRSIVAGYLNASWGMNYPYSTAQLTAMWDATVASGAYLELHTLLDAANNAMYRTDGGEHCPISASF
jgi:hypothetical protein